MADGLVSIRHRKPEVKVTAAQIRKQQKKASYQYALKQYVPNKVKSISVKVILYINTLKLFFAFKNCHSGQFSCVSFGFFLNLISKEYFCILKKRKKNSYCDVLVFMNNNYLRLL